MQDEVAARQAARSALEQLTEILGARQRSGRQHRILEGPTVCTCPISDCMPACHHAASIHSGAAPITSPFIRVPILLGTILSVPAAFLNMFTASSLCCRACPL